MLLVLLLVLVLCNAMNWRCSDTLFNRFYLLWHLIELTNQINQIKSKFSLRIKWFLKKSLFIYLQTKSKSEFIQSVKWNDFTKSHPKQMTITKSRLLKKRTNNLRFLIWLLDKNPHEKTFKYLKQFNSWIKLKVLQ